jgi:hypothetical protein
MMQYLDLYGTIDCAWQAETTSQPRAKYDNRKSYLRLSKRPIMSASKANLFLHFRQIDTEERDHEEIHSAYSGTGNVPDRVCGLPDDRSRNGNGSTGRNRSCRSSNRSSRACGTR